MNKAQAREKIKALISDYEHLKQTTKLDQNEQFTKDRFIRPLLEALGWDFRRDVWPEEQVSKGRVDYAFRIGDFNKFFVEAKKFGVDLEQSKWAEQVIEYAWNKSVTWAVLTDFEGIKIFNSEWKEKPYRAIKDITYDLYLDRFDELWLLSRESIERGELDTKAEEWGVKVKKEPVTEQLAKDMNEWRELFTQEINEWNKDKYSKEEIDEAVQRFLDRLIFIRYVEDKGLEPKILEPLLRDFKSSPGNGNIIPKLNEVFHKFDRWYDSRLFEKHFSEEMEGYSGKVEKIIEGLYQSKETGHPYDFSAIGADVLGAVYEQYLGYLQKKGNNNGGKSKRKEQGIYYTPTFIVDYIVRNTVGELIKDKSREDVKKIKILDPACGSGSFLIKAYETLEKYYAKYDRPIYDKDSKLGKIEKIFKNKQLVNTLTVIQKSNILRDSLYGVDLDPKAVEIAQLNLLLKAITRRTKLPNLSNRIMCGNSLISGTLEELKKYFGKNWRVKKSFNWRREFAEVFVQDGFDVIIGNPPYIQSRNLDDEERRYYWKQYLTDTNHCDIYSFFIEKAINLLRDKGILGFIIPNTWLQIPSFKSLRKKILTESKVLNILFFGTGVQIFKNVQVSSVVLILQREKNKMEINKNLINIIKYQKQGKLISVNRIPQNEIHLEHGFNIQINPQIKSVLQKINRVSIFLNLVGLIVGGLRTGDDERFLKKESNDKNDKKLLRGRNIDRYRLKWAREFVWYRPDLMKQKQAAAPKDSKSFEAKEKLLIRMISGEKIIATYDDEGYYLLQDNIILPKDTYNIKYILSILNSQLASYIVRNSASNIAITQSLLKSFPIYKIDFSDKKEKVKHDVLVHLVEKILNLHKELQEEIEKSNAWHKIKREIEKIDQEIDQEVYKLYGLTEEEITIIEKG